MRRAKLCRQARHSALLTFILLELGASWDYTSNGANWNGQGQCGSAEQQSPVNLPPAAPVKKDKKVFLKYPKIPSSFQLYHNGYSIAFTLPESHKSGFGLGAELESLQTKDGEAYRLWQVNFHSPSEHTLQGQRMPLEMQLMHQRVTGGGPETAVVVVLFQNAANKYLDFLDELMLGGLPDKSWEEKTIKPGLNFQSVVAGSPFYNYVGSLTVPPCETNVKYFVRQYPVGAAHKQLQAFQTILEKTCAPKGNFRLTRPLTGALSLIGSVDAATGKSVKPKPGHIDAKAVELAHPTPSSEDKQKNQLVEEYCQSGSYFDQAYKNRWRIRVGDSPELIKAKETYNRNLREMQVAEGAEGSALRSLKFAQKMYDNSPGLAEKISLKWALLNAKTVYDGAKAALTKYSGEWAAKELQKLTLAVTEDCYLKVKKQREAQKKKEEEEAKDVPPPEVPEPPPPPPPPEPFEYPEPHVQLPHGLGASPFAPKDEPEEVAEGVNADEGNAKANIAKVAPNLHTPDIPPSSSVDEASSKDTDVKKTPGEEDVTLSVVLPISQGAIPDKAAFGKDLVKALAKSAHIPPSRLEVKKMRGHAVAKVHSSGSAATGGFLQFLRVR